MFARSAALLAVLSVFSVQALAAVVVPVKAYVKTDEPIKVQFLNEKGEEGKKALTVLGLNATKLDNLFSPAPMSDILNADGTPNLTLFTSVGKPIAPVAAKLATDGTLDLVAAFPQLKEAGTFYLVWKDATPLVIQSLRNPIPWQATKDPSIPAADRAGIIQQFSMGKPVIRHIVALEYAVITTDKGVIKAKFAYDVAPHTVDNFIDLANQKMYDGSAFHRIMKGFMIQGGDSLATQAEGAGGGGPGYNLAAELSPKKHEKGTLSMARMGFSFDTAGSQFFIMHDKTPNLDNQYTAFGDVFEGMQVVDDIAQTPVTDNNGSVKVENRPRILNVRILPATPELYGLKK